MNKKKCTVRWPTRIEINNTYFSISGRNQFDIKKLYNIYIIKLGSVHHTHSSGTCWMAPAGPAG